MLHQVKCTLHFFGFPAWIQVLNKKINKLGNVVVVSRRFPFPEFQMLLPSGAQSRKLRDQPRHDLCFSWPVMTVEAPIWIVSHFRYDNCREQAIALIDPQSV